MAVAEDNRGAEVRARARRQPADWPEVVNLRIWVVETDDHYQALCENFTIAGMGATPEAAVRETFELLEDYIECSIADQAAWSEVYRPAPLRMRAPLWARYLAGRVARGLRHVTRQIDQRRLDERGLHPAHG